MKRFLVAALLLCGVSMVAIAEDKGCGCNKPPKKAETADKGCGCNKPTKSETDKGCGCNKPNK
jgi:hypothetical protein